MWQRLCNSETIYSEVPHQLMGDGCPVKAAIALKADYLSEEKKRNSSSNYTQHRSVLQTDKACNYSAIPNKEPAFRLMSTLR